MAGRLTLVKSVLLSIPNYFMATAKVPTTVCNEIERLAWMFLCGSDSSKRKPSLVNWQVCCSPMVSGGLGLRSLQVQNQLFLMKMGYNLITNTNAYWVQLLRKKYKVRTSIPETITRANASHLWRSLSLIWDKIKAGLIWCVRDGGTINFWDDDWVREVGPLRYFFQGHGELDLTIRVRDVILMDGR